MRVNYMILPFLLLFYSHASTAEWAKKRASIMGTEVAVEVWHEDSAKAATALGSVIQEMQRVDHLMSTHKETSELTLVNQRAAVEPVPVSAELYNLIDKSLKCSVKTQGAFDVTYASVGYLYDYRHASRPQQSEIQSALQAVDYRLVRLDADKQTITFKREGMRIDLGGIAKGYAVDQSIKILERQGIRHARVTAGGDTRVLGSRLGRPWTVGVRHPRSNKQMVAVIPLMDEAISTSGDYERYFDESGIRYHHIINPETGDSAREVRSVSIIGPKAVMTDALSTSVFVLGVESGLELINSMDDYEAIIVDKSGSMRYSKGLEQFKSANEPESSHNNLIPSLLASVN